MNISNKRLLSRIKKKARVRKKITGIAEKPRLTVFRSSKHIYAQVVDDSSGKTIVSCSTLDKEIASSIKTYTGNKESATLVGKKIAERLKDKGISNIVFDRNGYIYHGRVKSLAEAAREEGIKF